MNEQARNGRKKEHNQKMKEIWTAKEETNSEPKIYEQKTRTEHFKQKHSQRMRKVCAAWKAAKEKH